MVDGAALIMRAVAEGGASSAAPMREAALGEGAMLHHLAIAVAGKASASPLSLGWVRSSQPRLRLLAVSLVPCAESGTAGGSIRTRQEPS